MGVGDHPVGGGDADDRGPGPRARRGSSPGGRNGPSGRPTRALRPGPDATPPPLPRAGACPPPRRDVDHGGQGSRTGQGPARTRRCTSPASASARSHGPPPRRSPMARATLLAPSSFRSPTATAPLPRRSAAYPPPPAMATSHARPLTAPCPLAHTMATFSCHPPCASPPAVASLRCHSLNGRDASDAALAGVMASKSMPRLATADAPSTVVQPRPHVEDEVDIRRRLLPPYKVILHNDDHNPIPHVVKALQKSVPRDELRAGDGDHVGGAHLGQGDRDHLPPGAGGAVPVAPALLRADSTIERRVAAAGPPPGPRPEAPGQAPGGPRSASRPSRALLAPHVAEVVARRAQQDNGWPPAPLTLQSPHSTRPTTYDLIHSGE